MKTQVSDKTELASGFTVADYKTACDGKDGNTIADAIRRRFTERYVEPVTPRKGKQMHGFTIMAISCLMIEALESFRHGWPNTNGKSKAVFREFFETSPEFTEFQGLGEEFFKNVRCGILHQAETTSGWQITRKETAPLFESNTINATRFLQRLHEVLKAFCDGLKTDDWNSTAWENVRKKMESLCDNCFHP